MKINGSNQTNKVNLYQKQLQKFEQLDKEKGVKTDQVEISEEAKELQRSNDIHPARKKHVDRIKQEIESGTYRVDAEKIAERLLSFWDK